MITKTDAYLVPFAKLKAAAGSRNKRLLKAVDAKCQEMLEEADDNRNEDDTLTCAEALAQLVNGDDLRDVPDALGYLYGYALETLCAHLGEFAGEVDGDWTDELDVFFAERGVPLRFSNLVFGDEVINLPASADPPHIGSWPPEAVTEAVTALRAIDLDELSDEDEELAKAVGTVRQWVETAAGRAGWGVIGFSI